MEDTLIFVIKSQLKAQPPDNVFDVIRTAQFIITDTGARVPLETILIKLKYEIDNDLRVKLENVLNTGLLHEIVNELRTKKQPRCCFF
jgi:hypothetical protein